MNEKPEPLSRLPSQSESVKPASRLLRRIIGIDEDLLRSAPFEGHLFSVIGGSIVLSASFVAIILGVGLSGLDLDTLVQLITGLFVFFAVLFLEGTSISSYLISRGTGRVRALVSCIAYVAVVVPLALFAGRLLLLSLLAPDIIARSGDFYPLYLWDRFSAIDNALSGSPTLSIFAWLMPVIAVAFALTPLATILATPITAYERLAEVQLTIVRNSAETNLRATLELNRQRAERQISEARVLSESRRMELESSSVHSNAEHEAELRKAVQELAQQLLSEDSHRQDKEIGMDLR